MDQPAFELPKDTEKLGYKFIFDAIHRKTADVPLDEPLEVAPESPIIEPEDQDVIPTPQTFIEIPGKKYFRIGEVSELLQLEPHVIRYWESEFHSIRPTKSNTGHRVYRRKDVELLVRIKELLHHERYSIKGAKRKLQEERSNSGASSMQSKTPSQVQLKQELILALNEIELLNKSGIQTARNFNP